MIDFKKNFSLSTNEKANYEIIWIDSQEVGMGDFITDEQDGDRMKFTNTISKGFWIGNYTLTDDLFNELDCSKYIDIPKKTVLKDSKDLVFGLNFINCIEICDLLNKKYEKILPNYYFFSLPTEAHLQCVIKEGKANLNENLSEWCYDIAAYYPKKTSIDWVGNEEDYWYGDDIYEEQRDGRIRTLKCQSRARSYAHGGYNGYLDIKEKQVVVYKLTFRVCLRPITIYDIFDPFLKVRLPNLFIPSKIK